MKLENKSKKNLKNRKLNKYSKVKFPTTNNWESF